MHLALNLLGYAPAPCPWHTDYAAALVPRLLEQPGISRASLLATPYGAGHWRHLAGEHCSIVEVQGLDERKRRRFHAERYVLPHMLRELNVDSVFAPLGGSLLHPGPREGGAPVRYVYRLQSLAYQLEPWRYSLLEQMFYSSTIPASCKAADIVLVDHPEMAGSAADYGLAARARIVAVQPSATLPDPLPGVAALPQGLSPGRFVLVAGDDPGGALERRLSELVKQTQLPRGREDTVFVWCGRRHPESSLVSSSQLLHFEELSSEAYFALLAHCALLLCLGSGEGGLPPLRQALALGRPVLAVDTPAQRCIAGDSAQYSALRGLASTASALAILLSDGALCEELAQRALEQGRRYSWEESAQQIAQYLSAG